MTTSQDVIAKIKALLNTSGRDENEAALFVAKAQELMQRFDLSLSEVDAKVDPRTGGVTETGRTVLRQKGKPGSWKIELFRAVGQTTDVLTYASEASKWYDSTGYFVGREQDVELATYLYEFLTRELERLQNEYGKTRWAELRDYARDNGMSTHDAERDFSAMGTHPLRAKQSWIEGAVRGVMTVLWNEKRQRDDTPAAGALVVNKKAAIDDYLAQKRGFADAAAERADRTARATAYDIARGSGVEVEAEKPLTPSQQRRKDASDEAYWRRMDRKAETARRNKDRNTDWTAYSAGVETGKQITLRRGVKSGE